MILLYIHLIVTILAFLLLSLNVVKGTHIFRTRYPSLTIKRSHWADRVLTGIRTVFTCACPVLNFVMVYACIFYSDELCKKSVAKIYKECVEEQK